MTEERGPDRSKLRIVGPVEGRKSVRLVEVLDLIGLAVEDGVKLGDIVQAVAIVAARAHGAVVDDALEPLAEAERRFRSRGQ